MGNMEGGMLNRNKINEARDAKLTAENVAASQKPKEDVLDRSKITEARDARIETEIAQAGEKPAGEVLDRTLMQQQRNAAETAKANLLKKTIEERLSAVEEQVGLDGEKPFSKEGLLNRKFGK